MQNLRNYGQTLSYPWYHGYIFMMVPIYYFGIYTCSRKRNENSDRQTELSGLQVVGERYMYKSKTTKGFFAQENTKENVLQ
jgi:hypothetical protein